MKVSFFLLRCNVELMLVTVVRMLLNNGRIFICIHTFIERRRFYILFHDNICPTETTGDFQVVFLHRAVAV